MRRVRPEPSWPQSWRYSYPYDEQEIYGKVENVGYCYAYDNRRRHALRLLTQAVPPGARVLDLAAGQGNFSLTLAEQGYRVTWNDLRADLAGYVQLKHERGDIEFAPGNAFELTFAEPFDAVLMTEVIEHVAHPDEFLAKTAALVKPGGTIVMTTPNGAYFRNRLPRFADCADPSVFESGQFRPDADGHIFLLHPDEIHSLAARAGLVVDELVLFTNPLTNGHLKTAAALKVLPRPLVASLEHATTRLPQALRERVCVHLAARLQRRAAT
jgi:2-polyprenyl-6-hydroxyphenyl methylase/3-demethylubiquinone-9 3-methyltransferase